jgi:hypothetical protein
MLGRLGLPLTLVSAEGDRTVLGSPEGSMNPTVTRAPGVCDCTAAHSAPAFWITWSSTFVISAPLASPATAAGLPLVTPTILAPSGPSQCLPALLANHAMPYQWR